MVVIVILVVDASVILRAYWGAGDFVRSTRGACERRWGISKKPSPLTVAIVIMFPDRCRIDDDDDDDDDDNDDDDGCIIPSPQLRRRILSRRELLLPPSSSIFLARGAPK